MNLVLVGFMGSGKTGVGRRIAQRLGYGFLDMDQYIEGQAGCTIAQLFKEKGEAYFRRLESRIADRVHKLDNYVISTGGGILTSEGNLEKLNRAGLTIFLNADPEDILKRLERDTRRPKLKEGDLRETVTKLLGERMALYSQSAIIAPTKGKSVNRVAGEIIRMVAEHQAAQKQTEAAAGATPEGGKDEEAGAASAAVENERAEQTGEDSSAAPPTTESAPGPEAPPGEPSALESEAEPVAEPEAGSEPPSGE